jgi:hypothetical protein
MPDLKIKFSYNLKFHGLAIEFDSADFLRRALALHCYFTGSPAGTGIKSFNSTYEVNTDSRDVALSVGIVGETKQQARLSNTGVSDEEELEEVVVSISVRLGKADLIGEMGWGCDDGGTAGWRYSVK